MRLRLQVLDPDRPGRKLAMIGPSTNSPAMAHLASDADVVLHSATRLVGSCIRALQKADAEQVHPAAGYQCSCRIMYCQAAGSSVEARNLRVVCLRTSPTSGCLFAGLTAAMHVCRPQHRAVQHGLALIVLMPSGHACRRPGQTAHGRQSPLHPWLPRLPRRRTLRTWC